MKAQLSHARVRSAPVCESREGRTHAAQPALVAFAVPGFCSIMAVDTARAVMKIQPAHVQGESAWRHTRQQHKKRTGDSAELHDDATTDRFDEGDGHYGERSVRLVGVETRSSAPGLTHGAQKEASRADAREDLSEFRIELWTRIGGSAKSLNTR